MRSQGARYGLARVLSKRGVCSRSEAERRIRDGRVQLDGQVV
nr:S4 domain-containing protein [Pseudomonadota bacterium]